MAALHRKTNQREKYFLLGIEPAAVLVRKGKKKIDSSGIWTRASEEIRALT